MDMLADQYIFEGRHVGEQADVLVSARYAQLCDLVRTESSYRLPLKQNVSAIGFVESGDAVEKGCFAGTVRSNHTIDGLVLDLKVKVLDCRQAAEALDDCLGN